MDEKRVAFGYVASVYGMDDVLRLGRDGPRGALVSRASHGDCVVIVSQADMAQLPAVILSWGHGFGAVDLCRHPHELETWVDVRSTSRQFLA